MGGKSDLPGRSRLTLFSLNDSLFINLWLCLQARGILAGIKPTHPTSEARVLFFFFFFFYFFSSSFIFFHSFIFFFFFYLFIFSFIFISWRLITLQ